VRLHLTRQLDRSVAQPLPFSPRYSESSRSRLIPCRSNGPDKTADTRGPTTSTTGSFRDGSHPFAKCCWSRAFSVVTSTRFFQTRLACARDYSRADPSYPTPGASRRLRAKPAGAFATPDSSPRLVTLPVRADGWRNFPGTLAGSPSGRPCRFDVCFSLELARLPSCHFQGSTIASTVPPLVVR